MLRIRAVLTLSMGLLAAGLLAGISSATAQDDVLYAEGQDPDVRVEVRDLKRGDGGTVTLRLRLVNETGEAFDASCQIREAGSNDSCGTFSGVYLLDAANQKKYLVVRDSEQNCVCSTIDRLDDGKRMNLWATFPAPPADVERVTVVVQQFEPIEGVPITGP